MRTMTAAVALLAAVGCSPDDQAPAAGPTVSLAVAPAPGSMGVARDDTVHLWFPMAMDSASCADRFRLHVGDADGSMVPGRMLRENDGRHVMFVPDSLLAPGQRYTAHLRDGMRAVSGGDMGGMGMGPGGPTGEPLTLMPPPGGHRMVDGVGWEFRTGP